MAYVNDNADIPNVPVRDGMLNSPAVLTVKKPPIPPTTVNRFARANAALVVGLACTPWEVAPPRFEVGQHFCISGTETYSILSKSSHFVLININVKTFNK